MEVHESQLQIQMKRWDKMGVCMYVNVCIQIGKAIKDHKEIEEV